MSREACQHALGLDLAPQKDWEADQPDRLAKPIETLEGIQEAFNGAQCCANLLSKAPFSVGQRQLLAGFTRSQFGRECGVVGA
jgi:catalase (peroxidase I)